MKTIIFYALTAAITASVTSCGEPVQKFKVEVVDEANSPMPDAEVAAWFNKSGKSSLLASYKVVGTTNDKGLVEIQGETVWYQTSVSSQPPGYYSSMKFDHWTKKSNGNRWEPWPVEVRLVMKKIIEPHPMDVCKLKNHGRFIISRDAKGPLGFDLLKRDWVAPDGKGERADLFIEGVKLNGGEPVAPMRGYKVYQGYAHITFPRNGDGIVPAWEESGGSELLGPQKAPEEGYLKEWKFTNYELPEGEHLNPVKDARTLVFRVRTDLDEKGKVVSAIYGKLPEGMEFTYGPFGGGITMTYYLNETPNDRRLEWDMKTNLFKDPEIGDPGKP